jgi:Lrp/AsnC family transcriptional regulator for asnA, asnC and gidA
MSDLINTRLVSLLGRDARQSSEALAEKLNTSSATIRRRMRKLIQNDLLRIVGVVDRSKFGFPLGALIIVDAVPDKIDSLLEALSKRPEIHWMSTTTGRSDIVAIGLFTSTDSLSNFLTKVLRQMEGVRNSETLICLDVKKGRYTPLAVA